MKILATLAFAQNGNHEYAQALATVQLIHSLDHKGFASVHYIAASAAMSMKDYAAMERELRSFLAEDPTGEFAPTAQKISPLWSATRLYWLKGPRARRLRSLLLLRKPQLFPILRGLKHN